MPQGMSNIKTPRSLRRTGRFAANYKNLNALYHHNQKSDAAHGKGGKPRDGTLCDDDENRLSASHFPTHGGDCRDAGGIQQAENKEDKGGERGKDRCDRSFASEQDSQRADDAFLGDKAGDKRGRKTPVAKAKRSENW